MTSNNGPSRGSGKLHSLKGSIKDSVGSALHLGRVQQSGKEEHAAGQARLQAGRGKNYAGGTADRAVGKKDKVAGALTGDRAQEAAGHARGAKGEGRQNWNKISRRFRPG